MKEIKIIVYPAYNQKNVFIVLSGVGFAGKRIERFAELNKKQMKKRKDERVCQLMTI